LTDAPANPGPLPPPPPARGHGCLWGCLIAVLIVVAAAVGGVFYLKWFMTNGFKNDAGLKAVMQTVNANPTARSVLGGDIKLDSITSVNISNTFSAGEHAHYILVVTGSKASGTLEAAVQVMHGKATILALALTGPDGHRYDLSDGAPQAPPDTSI
jgi:hypothetical protein